MGSDTIRGSEILAYKGIQISQPSSPMTLKEEDTFSKTLGENFRVILKERPEASDCWGQCSSTKFFDFGFSTLILLERWVRFLTSRTTEQRLPRRRFLIRTLLGRTSKEGSAGAWDDLSLLLFRKEFISYKINQSQSLVQGNCNFEIYSLSLETNQEVYSCLWPPSQRRPKLLSIIQSFRQNQPPKHSTIIEARVRPYFSDFPNFTFTSLLSASFTRMFLVIQANSFISGTLLFIQAVSKPQSLSGIFISTPFTSVTTFRVSPSQIQTTLQILTRPQRLNSRTSGPEALTAFINYGAIGCGFYQKVKVQSYFFFFSLRFALGFSTLISYDYSFFYFLGLPFFLVFSG